MSQAAVGQRSALLQAILPIAGFTALMCDGVDYDATLRASINYRVWKAIAQASACSIRVARPCLVMFCYAAYRRSYLEVEVVAKTCLTIVVEFNASLEL